MKNSTPEHSSKHDTQRPKLIDDSRWMRAWLACLELMVLAMGLSGCASAPIDQPQSVYNPVTGYPAVGDYSWRH